MKINHKYETNLDQEDEITVEMSLGGVSVFSTANATLKIIGKGTGESAAKARVLVMVTGIEERLKVLKDKLKSNIDS